MSSIHSRSLTGTYEKLTKNLHNLTKPYEESQFVYVCVRLCMFGELCRFLEKSSDGVSSIETRFKSILPMYKSHRKNI